MSTVIADLHPMADTAGFLAGGGEMGMLMRNFDWETTPLGPPSRWPNSLQVVVRILLASREPLAVWWAGGAALIYNDACRDLIGGPPPDIGGPVPESWINGSSGLNLSLHPLPGERGQLGGVLCTFPSRSART
jgi:hypothetical protein